MKFYIDLRHIVPPFTNLFFMLWLSSVHHLNATLLFVLVIAIILTFAFLLISIELPLTVTADGIRFQVGDFSAAVSIGLLCSILLSPTHFWISYPTIIAISPLYPSLFNLIKRLLYWFYQLLQSIPAIYAVFFTQQDEHPQQEPPPPPPQVEAELAEIEGDQLQEQPSSSDFEVVVNSD